VSAAGATSADRILSNLERRVIANLSIPRNEADLTQMIRSDAGAGAPEFDPRHAQLRPNAPAIDALERLKDEGWIVSLGSRHESPGKVAALVDSHKQAFGMPDEKARLYEKRLNVPHRVWRGRGELWVMTAEGFDKLHDPTGVGDPTPLATWEVEQRIRQEFARVHQGEIGERTQLGGRLLEDEWLEWAKAVQKAHKAATGDEVMLPIAGGAGYSDATELLILDPENGKGSAYTETAPWFMAAVTVAVTDADTGSTITEANYTGYARKSVAAADMGSAAAGSAANVNAITFAAATAGTSAVIGHAKCVAATVGRLIKSGTCSTVNVSATQQPLNFAVGAYTTTLD
jgi:hypothetical protein